MEALRHQPIGWSRAIKRGAPPGEQARVGAIAALLLAANP
jgi:hypothetical protein